MGCVESLTALLRRRESECRLTPDLALQTLGDAETFLRGRGLLTRTADCALPSLYEACHEDPYKPGSPGFGSWPATKWPWFGDLAGRGAFIAAVHRGKNLLVTSELAGLLDPLAAAGPSSLDDLRVELRLKRQELRALRAPLERCGAIVARSLQMTAGDEHLHSSELARWDQVHPGSGGTAADPRRALADLIGAGVRAAVVAPERELRRWVSWQWFWTDTLVDDLVRGRRRRPAKLANQLCLLPFTADQRQGGEESGRLRRHQPLGEYFIEAVQVAGIIKRLVVQHALVDEPALSEAARYSVSLELPDVWCRQLRPYLGHHLQGDVLQCRVRDLAHGVSQLRHGLLRRPALAPRFDFSFQCRPAGKIGSDQQFRGRSAGQAACGRGVVPGGGQTLLHGRQASRCELEIAARLTAAGARLVVRQAAATGDASKLQRIHDARYVPADARRDVLVGNQAELECLEYHIRGDLGDIGERDSAAFDVRADEQVNDDAVDQLVHLRPGHPCARTAPRGKRPDGQERVESLVEHGGRVAGERQPAPGRQHLSVPHAQHAGLLRPGEHQLQGGQLGRASRLETP